MAGVREGRAHSGFLEGAGMFLLVGKRGVGIQERPSDPGLAALNRLSSALLAPLSTFGEIQDLHLPFVHLVNLRLDRVE